MHRNFLISLMLVSLTATGGIYKWVDDEGKTHYTDKEESGGTPVELPKAVTYTPTAATSVDDKTSKEEAQKKVVYTKMAIIKPKMNETIRDNNGNVEVMLELTPPLGTGDSISLYLDGKEVKKGLTITSVTLRDLERGSHTVRASVFDKNHVALISTKSVIFHLKRQIVDKKIDTAPTDNSEAYTPSYDQDESAGTDYGKDYSNDYSGDFSKDYDSSDTYKEEGKKYNTGVPSNSGNYDSGSSTYTPNYKQK